MKIESIEAQNFRSFSHFKLNLNNLGLTLLNGQNTGISNDRTNGSGKSSLIYAMIYALYGETPDGAKSDEVIKNDVNKNCYAKVVFTHFNHLYEITRYRKDKEFKNKVIMLCDGKDVTLSTNKETDKEIIATLGFGLDTLLNSIIFSPEKLNSFISATDKHRKEILEELTNTNIYKQALQLVKEDSKKSSAKLSEDNKELSRLDVLMDNQTALEKQYEQSKAMQKQQLTGIKNQVQSKEQQLAGITIDENGFKQVKQQYAIVSNQVQHYQFNQNHVHQDKLSQTKQQINNYAMQQSNLKNELTKLFQVRNKLLNSKKAHCEWCGNILDAEHKQVELDKINKKAKELGCSYNEINEPRYQLEQQLPELEKLAQSEKESITNQQQEYSNLSNQLRTLQGNINEYQNQINAKQRLQHEIEQLNKNYQQANQPILPPKELDKESIQKQIKGVKKDLHKQQQSQTDFEKLTKIYSDRGVKAQALSLVIPYLNDQLAKILKVLTNDTMTVALNNKTTTKSGKVNEQISLDVDSSVSGSNYQDLSSGEKRRIGIALNLAFMNYLKSQIGGLNLVVFDEVFDSLDKAGIDSVINVLNSLKQDVDNIIIVSHNDDMKYNDNIDTQLLVKKVDNTSTLINN